MNERDKTIWKGTGVEWDGMGAKQNKMEHNGTEQNEKVTNTSVAPPFLANFLPSSFFFIPLSFSLSVRAV